MSTPVSSCTPRESRSVANVRDEEELAQQMQRMIRLQYEQQRMFAAEQQTSTVTGRTTTTETVARRISSPPTSMNMPQQQQTSFPIPPPPIPTSPHSCSSYQQQQQQPRHPRSNSPVDSLDESMLVGRGTLILRHPEELLLRRNNSSQCGPGPGLAMTAGTTTHPRSPSSSSSTTLTGDLPPPTVVTTPQVHVPLGESQPLPSIGTSYGALDTMMLKLENSQDDEQDAQAPSHPQQSSSRDEYYAHTADTTQQQRHYVSPPPPPSPPSIASLLFLFLDCLLLQPLATLLASESLHRSFVYGGIDGMLTGAGIVSACAGLGLLPPPTTGDEDPVVLAHVVVALTAAACCADSVCMAVGHVWTTHVHATAHAAERADARQALQHTKAQAKSTLVDLLLARGVLKLDAMSLVDTLEGYPDLFVSAVTGDALVGGGAAQSAATTANSTTPSSMDELTQLMVSSASVVDQEEQRLYQASTQHDGVSSSSWRGFLSYGRLTDLDMDPDHVTVRHVVAESRKESLCMMLGFSLLSVVPSFIYTWVPSLLVATSMAHSTKDNAANSMMIHPNTLVVFLSACVMWCLGVWKSRFMDSNWLLFGIETVMVLLVCIACAYTLGATLNYVFLPDTYVIQVVKPIVKVSKQVHYKSQMSIP